MMMAQVGCVVQWYNVDPWAAFFRCICAAAPLALVISTATAEIVKARCSWSTV